ncbi:Branchless trichome [Tripterygium wilfordii]|uniref:Branchless trichome n=1 Tax=Tripterygium wilfordii TaxID=458696 RepID=A0A7J7CK51_TRIWF|nr:uncharacterized protein LOC119981350 [Tripterygium wilfordii]KAF5734366.1 Branchless trichome [Tripterygium wilfordii]
MGEEVMMMMSSRSSTSSSSSSSENPTFPTWKLYENPFYYSQPHHHHHHKLKHQYHRLNAGASLLNLSLFKPVMETSEIDVYRAQILELKAKLEYERKVRKKMESLNKRLAKELTEERSKRSVEKVCQELAREITLDKAEIDSMKREIEEERKMLRVAELLREERVQMKLSAAKIFLEEKIQELEISKQQRELGSFSSKLEQMNQEEANFMLPGKFTRLVLAENSYDDDLSSAKSSKVVQSRASPETEKINQEVDNRVSRGAIPAENFPGKLARLSSLLSEKSCDDNISGNIASSAAIQRRASPEPENPHIKRGIKGFVEFPRVVRAIGSKSSGGSRHWGSNLECQKAQLRILLKQKSPIRSNNLIIG